LTERKVLATEYGRASIVRTVEVEEKMPSAPVVILGFGRVGHFIEQIREIAGIAYVALHHNPSLVVLSAAAGANL